jgi:hypothetical protein
MGHRLAFKHIKQSRPQRPFQIEIASLFPQMHMRLTHAIAMNSSFPTARHAADLSATFTSYFAALPAERTVAPGPPRCATGAHLPPVSRIDSLNPHAKGVKSHIVDRFKRSLKPA